MVQVKYLGEVDSREISKEDFAAIPSGLGGPLDHDTVTWDASNVYIADVNEEVAKWLERSYPNDFKKLTKKEAADSKKAATASLMPDQEPEEEESE